GTEAENKAPEGAIATVSVGRFLSTDLGSEPLVLECRSRDQPSSAMVTQVRICTERDDPKSAGVVCARDRAFSTYAQKPRKGLPGWKDRAASMRNWRPFSGGNGADVLLSAFPCLTLVESDCL